MDASDLLVWMDLEMTGLDPARDHIIEAAALITNGQLEVVAEGPNLVIHQPAEVLDAMDAWNQEHHGASGLVARVKSSTTTEEGAESELLAFVKKHCEPRSAPLAGNSIHQDRRFIQRYWPRLDAHLHYRNVDVSTVKELVRRWLPDVLAKATPKKDAHRALDDIRESIEELKYYRAHAFRNP